MTIRILPVDRESPDPAALEEAASILRSGGIVAFPTETVYGLGANGLDPEAVQKIYDAKERPAGNPLILHVARVEQARELAAEWPTPAQRLVDTFWSGPLTLVLKKTSAVPDIVTAGLPTFAVRMPDHPVARALLHECEFPVAAPSANRYTGVSPTRAEHVAMALGDRVPLVLDAGATDIGIESTVIAVSEDHVTLLRPGMISAVDIESASGVPLRRLAAIVADHEARPSPGQSARHYAPEGRVILGSANEVAQLPRATRGLAVLFNQRPLPRDVTFVQAPADPAAYAHELYDWLHRADELDCVFIYLEDPPDSPEWEGIRDRLRRASREL
jgi:L-threonylcarbamoyladenylate synthase